MTSERTAGSRQKRIARFFFIWLLSRPFVFASAFGYWIGTDNLTYWECVKKLWKEP